ncbi:MAG TPA: cytidine deaminase [Oscillospiraceae bacterium]|nr:cytidine deaminase [Oscillospiraceae bacterium]
MKPNQLEWKWRDMILEQDDLALIEAARAAIRKNYDKTACLHTVGTAVRCANGNIYTGVNLYSIHGACAEQVALGAAVTVGERDFACIVAVRGEMGEEILSPCGNCRQILADYAPRCAVIVRDGAGPVKMPASELLPFAYRTET